MGSTRTHEGSMKIDVGGATGGSSFGGRVGNDQSMLVHGKGQSEKDDSEVGRSCVDGCFRS